MHTDLIDKKIISIIRIDEFNDYEFYCPIGLFIDFGEEQGLYFGITADKSINVDLMTKDELTEQSGFEYSECDLNGLRENDELNRLIGQRIKEIKVACFKDSTIKGETFELQLGGYAGIKLYTDEQQLVFYNDNGGHVSINDNNEIPNKDRWTWI